MTGGDVLSMGDRAESTLSVDEVAPWERAGGGGCLGSLTAGRVEPLALGTEDDECAWLATGSAAVPISPFSIIRLRSSATFMYWLSCKIINPSEHFLHPYLHEAKVNQGCWLTFALMILLFEASDSTKLSQINEIGWSGCEAFRRNRAYSARRRQGVWGPLCSWGRHQPDCLWRQVHLQPQCCQPIEARHYWEYFKHIQLSLSKKQTFHVRDKFAYINSFYCCTKKSIYLISILDRPHDETEHTCRLKFLGSKTPSRLRSFVLSKLEPIKCCIKLFSIE